jgi:hypothetical protein
MAKLQHTFIKGKMNKDLDERLIPNGEYRDASNVQVSTSEGADVGAVENIIGNTKLNKKTNAVNWDPKFGLTDPVCIGTIKDSQNNKIYWFLATDPDGADYKSVILEFDQLTGFIAPILVDRNNVINFTKENLITGINILGGLLFFTDNTSEPKVINIARFKAGSQQTGTTITTQTVVYGGPMTLETVTVIVKSPNQAATVLAEPSLVGGNGTGVTPVTTGAINFNAGTPAFTPVAPGTVFTGISWTPAVAFDSLPVKMSLTATVTNESNIEEVYEVTGNLSNISANGLSGDFTVISTTTNVPNTGLAWSMLLIETDPIFRNDFPRYSYRWKYTDNEYSTYAPFTEAAFVTNEFEYLSTNAFNNGMENMTRKITLSAFQAPTTGVVAIDILYKGANSNNIYVIETIDLLAGALNTFVITNELLGVIIESSQLLRPWDNVPRKAKSQEVIGNRIVYGNYLQNNTVNRAVNIVTGQVNGAHSNVGYGLQSVKSDRTYQVGITFIDEFNRESPVFTNKTASQDIEIKNAEKVNYLTARLASTPPSWAVACKYYIKEPSLEYYNIALDRFYNSEDGCVWLSFPSAEVNKIQEGEYMLLKKQHDTSVAVTENNRYKVLDISNEAPVYISNQNAVAAQVQAKTLGNSADNFIVGKTLIRFSAPQNSNAEIFYNLFNNESSIQFSSGVFTSSIYSIANGGPGTVATNAQTFTVTLGEPLKVSDQWLEDLDDIGSAQSITATLYNKSNQNLPEFQGRFFVKINKDQTFIDNVDIPFREFSSSIIVDQSQVVQASNTNTGGADTSNNLAWSDPKKTNGPALKIPTFNDADFNIGLALATPGTLEYKLFFDLVPGTQIRFFDANNNFSNVYTVLTGGAGATPANTGIYNRNTTPNTTNGAYNQIVMTSVYNDSIVPAGIQIVSDRIAPDTDTIASTNPAVFETEPNDAADLNLYYEIGSSILKGVIGNTIDLNWWNAYSFGQGVESDRIRDDFNALRIGNGVRVSSTLDTPYEEERRGSSMIFSGIFNSISGVNNTNQFLVAENITKSLNTTYGKIQKLHARDTDLIVLMEDKCFRVLANKDALFNADGSSNVASSNNVLGSVTPFVGEYGISTNPESFASFGFRAYFVDKSRGAVMRLSRDGLTKISSNGMSDYFIDNLKLNTIGNITGSYDSDAGSYNVCIKVPGAGSESVAFKEKVNGWTTTMSYVPEAGTSLNNEYYTFKSGEIWEHSNETRSNFYGAQFNSTVTPIINDAPTSVKKFKTLAYEGTAGWRSEIVTDQQNGEVPVFVKKEGSFYNYIQGIDTTVANLDTQEFSTQGLGSLLLNAPIGTSTIVINGAINVSLQANPQNPGGGAAGVAALDTIYTMSPGNTLRIVGTVIGINRTTNTITLAANIAGSALQAGDFVFFGKDTRINTSGIIGYYAETKMITTDSTKEELFSISSEVFISSE